jgi:hypothetical protein
MLFRGRDGTLTSIRVSDAFKSRDGLSRQSRLRYDTPVFYGFSLAGSLVSNQRYDAALFWSGEIYGFRAMGALALSDPKEIDAGLQYDGSFSILHKKTGLNLTLSAGLLEKPQMPDATNLYVKLGWLTRFFDAGETAFGIDYTLSNNLPSTHDRGYSISFAAVQEFSRVNTELYLQYRLYSLKTASGMPFYNLNVGTLGMRVKF